MLAIESKLPVRGRKRSDYLPPASTGTLVRDCAVLHRDIQDSFFEDFRYELDKAVFESTLLQEQISALTILFRLVVNVQS